VKSVEYLLLMTITLALGLLILGVYVGLPITRYLLSGTSIKLVVIHKDASSIMAIIVNGSYEEVLQGCLSLLNT